MEDEQDIIKALCVEYIKENSIKKKLEIALLVLQTNPKNSELIERIKRQLYDPDIVRRISKRDTFTEMNETASYYFSDNKGDDDPYAYDDDVEVMFMSLNKDIIKSFSELLKEDFSDFLD